MNMFHVLKLVKIKKNERRYIKYIEEHRKNVKRAFNFICRCKDPFIQQLLMNDAIYWAFYIMVDNHDISKYSDDEFDAYRKNFFPINKKEREENKEKFEKAWEHHIKNNPHHWQNRQLSKSLNKEATLEMILDWIAMGYTYHDNAIEYYKKNKNKIKLNPEERIFTEKVLSALYHTKV